MGEKLVRYRWRYFCEIRKKFVSTRNHLPEDLIKWEHPDAVPIEGTRIESELCKGDDYSLCFSNILRGVKDVGNGIVAEEDEKKPPDEGG